MIASCDWRMNSEKKACSALLLVSCFRLMTFLLASVSQCFPLIKRRRKFIKKVLYVEVLIYFVIPVLITVEKPPL